VRSACRQRPTREPERLFGRCSRRRSGALCPQARPSAATRRGRMRVTVDVGARCLSTSASSRVSVFSARRCAARSVPGTVSLRYTRLPVTGSSPANTRTRSASPRRSIRPRFRLALSSPGTPLRLLAPKAAPRREFSIFISACALIRGGAGGVRTHDLTDYEDARAGALRLLPVALFTVDHTGSARLAAATDSSRHEPRHGAIVRTLGRAATGARAAGRTPLGRSTSHREGRPAALP
jgi:hypothetical protein